ncbi:hypothetical protein [Kingella oralis]
MAWQTCVGGLQGFKALRQPETAPCKNAPMRFKGMGRVMHGKIKTTCAG